MVMEMKSVVRVVRSGALKTHPVQDKSAKPFPIYDRNRPLIFTVVCSVTWPLDGSEAGVDFVMIQTPLLLSCKGT